jgi:arsenate reductase-like glutaredoxin family protein
MNKSAIIALILLGVYAASTFTFAILQSVRTPATTQFPTDNIINYSFVPSLQYQLIRGGVTIMTFEYGPNCNSCLDQKDFLESMATNYKEVLYTNPNIYSLYLEEVLNDTFTSSSNLTVSSLYGNRTLANPTQNDTFSALCDLMSKPPTTCVTR